MAIKGKVAAIQLYLNQHKQLSETGTCFVVLQLMAALHRCVLPLAKHQGGFGLRVVVAGRRATDKHGSAAVPTQ